MKQLRLKALAVAAALLCGGVANAASIAISPATATAGTGGGATTPATLAVNYTADASTVGYQVRIAYPTASLDVTVTPATGVTCSNNDAGGEIIIINNDAGGNPLPSGNQCTLTFTVVGAQAAGTTFTLDTNTAGTGDGCFDTNLAPTTCTTGDGTITITAGPQSPLLTFTPPGGAVTLNASGAGTIGVAADANTGTATPLTCTATNATATVTGSPFAANGTGSVAIQCTPQVGVTQPVTVSCDPAQPQGTDQAAVNFTATCPAITPQPEFSGALSASLVGAPGATLSGAIGISNTGNAPLTITCGAPSAGFTVTSPPAASVAAGGSTSIGISCVAPAAAGATATGSLVCTTNDSDETTVTFALSCTSQVLSVPALGNTAKGMLVALLAGLGLLGFAMRRRIV